MLKPSCSLNIDMFHGTISWKMKSSFNRNFEKNKRTVTSGIGEELFCLHFFSVVLTILMAFKITGPIQAVRYLFNMYRGLSSYC